ncbi:MAG: hypothetical protein WCF94_03840 [bacterium]
MPPENITPGPVSPGPVVGILGSNAGVIITVVAAVLVVGVGAYIYSAKNSTNSQVSVNQTKTIEGGVGYYKNCDSGFEPSFIKVIDSEKKYANVGMPKSILYKEKCFKEVLPLDAEKIKAVEVTDWEDKICTNTCGNGTDILDNNSSALKRLEYATSCIANIIDVKILKNYEKAVKNITKVGTNYFPMDAEALFLNGKVIPDCVMTNINDTTNRRNTSTFCTEPRTFGGHVAWIKNEIVSGGGKEDGLKSYVYYDGNLYDQNDGVISEMFLYDNGILYQKQVNGQLHVIYNGKDYGDINSLRSNSEYLDLGDFKYNLGDGQIGHLDYFYNIKLKPEEKYFDKNLVLARQVVNNGQISKLLQKCNTDYDRRKAGSPLQAQVEYDECLKYVKTNKCGTPEIAKSFPSTNDWCNGLIYGRTISLVGKKPLIETWINGEVLDSKKVPNDPAIYFGGNYYPVKNTRNKGGTTDGYFWDSSFRDSIVSDWLVTVSNALGGDTLYANGILALDGKDSQIVTAKVFKDKWAVVDKSGQVFIGGAKIVIDDKTTYAEEIDLGQTTDSESVILYEDNVAFKTKVEKIDVMDQNRLYNNSDRIYFGENLHSGSSSVNLYGYNSSILSTMYACRQKYIEDNKQ